MPKLLAVRYACLAVIFSLSTPVAQAETTSLESRLDVLTQLEELRTEVQSLRGQLEVAQHQQMQFEQQLRDFYSDLDKRMVQLQSQETSKMVAPVTVSKTPAANEVQKTYVGSPGMPTEKPAVPPTAVIAVDNTEAVNVIKNAKSDLDAYQAAYLFLQNKQYSEALAAFTAYLEAYPQGEYAANVYYWLGEVYLIEHHYSKAEQEFSKVLSQYPDHQKAADALLKLGYVYEAMGNKQQALTTYQKVQQQYPNTAVAQLAQTKAAQLK